MVTEKLKRRLAAILALDVVGFSRLMHADEAGAFALVKQLSETVFQPAVEAADGAIFKHTGDGVLARFDSVHDAFDAAEAIIAAIVDNGQAAVRIGIHLGDVIDSAGDTFGDSVNIACRLESLALQNGICISERAWSDLRQRNVAFRDLGVQQLKNIATPIRVYMHDPSDNGAKALRRPSWLGRLRWPRTRLLVAMVAIAVSASAGAWLMWRPDPTRTAITGVLDDMACSWLAVGDVTAENGRRQAVIAGYSDQPPGNIRDNLQRRVRRAVDYDLSGVAALPPYVHDDCRFLQQASSRREPAGAGSAARSGLRARLSRAATRADAAAAGVPPAVFGKAGDAEQMWYRVDVAVKGLTPNAQWFAIDAVDGLQALGSLTRERGRWQTDANGWMHVWIHSDQPTPGLLFMIDGPNPIALPQGWAQRPNAERERLLIATADAAHAYFALVVLSPQVAAASTQQ